MSVTGSGTSARIEGLTALRLKLKELDTALPVEVKAVNKEAAVLVAAEIRGRAPVGSGRDKHPGRLKGTVRPGATLTQGVVRIGGKTTPYARPIVFGWPKRNIRPNPFPYTGLDVRRAEVVRLYEVRVAEITEKVFG